MFYFLRGMFGWIGRMFANAFAVLGTLIALFIVLVGMAMLAGTLFSEKPAAHEVLSLDVRGGFLDAPVPGFITGRPLSFVETLFALERASQDPRIDGLILRVGEGGIAAAHAQELKQAIASFKAGKAGRFVIAHAGSFSGPGIGQYYLASLADEIWIQRSSEVGAVGMLSTTVFLRGLLDKIQAVPEFGQRYEFKNAANVYTETDYTPAHREATTRLLQAVYDTLTTDIAAQRKMDVSALRTLFDNGPYLTEGALNAKLVDRTGFYDDARDSAKARAGSDTKIITLGDYFQREGSPYDRVNGPGIALIMAEGAIKDGASRYSYSSETELGGDTIAKALADAADNADVIAIVLRVNSPGGSALASDVILDQVRKAQGRGKKVIVSMGPVAASGGYWISMYADQIFASPATITGSIGVLSGKLMLADTYRLVGLNPAQIGIGQNATYGSEFVTFTPEQRAKFEAGLDQIYAAFTFGVSEGRKLPIERVREIAKGRVWAGSDAMGLKLIDQFGGLEDAMKAAAKAGGLDPNVRFSVKIYPEVSSWDVFWQTMSSAATSAEKMSAVAKALDSPSAQALLRLFDDSQTMKGNEVRMNEAAQ